MSSVKSEISVQAPQGRVFDVFSDIPHAAERIPDIVKVEMLTDGPVGAGTEWRETRVMFKKEHTEQMKIDQFEPNQRYTVIAESCGTHYCTEFRFRPEGSGTKVELEITAKPLTLPAKLMSPLSFMMKGMLRKCLESDLKALKGYVEEQSEPASEAAAQPT